MNKVKLLILITSFILLYYFLEKNRNKIDGIYNSNLGLLNDISNKPSEIFKNMFNDKTPWYNN